MNQWVKFLIGWIAVLFSFSCIAGTSYHTVSVQSDTSMLAWGYNAYGQLGDGTLTNRSNPVAVKDTGGLAITGVRAVATGQFHTLALKADGTVVSWGNNAYGQLGDGTLVDQSNPVTITGLTGIIAIAAGVYHNLALKSDGTLYTWGSNWGGQLGDGTKTDRTSPLVIASAGSGIVAIAAGNAHSLALKSDGTMLAWGNNGSGQVGDGTTINKTSPVPVADAQAAVIQNIVAIAAGGSHSLALLADGTIMSWGYNAFGQLGDGTTSNRSNPTTVVDSGSIAVGSVVAISAGEAHSSALTNSGTGLSWGHNFYGQLGDGTSINRVNPVPIIASGGSNITGISAITSGLAQTILLKNDGTMQAYGFDAYGQLGDGTTVNRLNPVFVTNSGGGNTSSTSSLMGLANTGDKTPPVITVPKDIYVIAVDVNGTPASNSTIATFLAAAVATDIVDGSITVTNDALGTFAVGTTVVTFSAVDTAGNSGTAVANVVISQTALFSPANGTVLSNATKTFSWTDTGANAYYLMVGSARVGGNDIYNSGVLPAGTTSATVSGLPADVYVRHYARNAAGGWDTSDYKYTYPLVAASITTPISGSTLTGATQQFSWTDTGATGYYVMISSTAVGGNNLYISGFLAAGTTSVTATGLPSDGKPIYVRLYSWKSGGWQITDSNYVATGTASISSPTNNIILGSGSQTFSWTATGAAGYYLSVGRTLGQADVFQSGWITGTSINVSNLPTAENTPLYVRLYSWTKSGEWQVQISNYIASYATSLTSPVAGSSLGGTSQTFVWNDTGATGYYLDIGSDYFGHGDLYKSGFLNGPVNSQLVTGLPTGSVPLYVRLYTWGADGWRTSDVLFTSAP